VEEFGDPQVREVAVAEIAAPEGWATATGRVVAADIAGDRAVVTIDAGSDEGVRQGNAVLTTGGLVGEVRTTSTHSATVQLVTDPGSEIGVRILPSKEIAVSRGQGMDADLRIDFLSPAAIATAGDRLLTLGSTTRDGIPPDLPIGTVTAVDTLSTPSGRVVTAVPVTGMTSLDTVLVLTEKP
jgi:rod shape-determining protein MreC